MADEQQLKQRLAALRIERASRSLMPQVRETKAGRPGTRTRPIWIAACLALVASSVGLGVRYFRDGARSSSEARAAASVPVASPTPVAASAWVAAARVEATRQVRLSARVTAPIVRVHVREGQRVQVGDPLIDLDGSWAEQDAVVAKAEARANRAKLAVRQAEQAEVERRLAQEARLVKSAVLSLETLRQRRAERVQLLKNIRAEKLELQANEARTVRVELERDAYALRAPFDAVVAAPPAGVGQLVGPMQEPVIELYDVHSLRVVADVAEARLARVTLGQRCTVSLDAAPEAQVQAEVERLAPRLDRAKATLAVYLRVTSRELELRPSMAGRVECNEGVPR
ncbi:MAG: efflux RND transporter periplasmic adaptor subunit [Polyangiaceae bacterium]|nr:efflux RND transporter periplasmic adaptor subunit [Myxococcales bacterium]MCB9589748.1 efflux RND transporter periplasmic adaptor subunit [Polyangiaceae bacterium]